MMFSKNDTLKIKGIAILMMYIHHFYLSADRYGKYAVDFFPLTETIAVYIASALIDTIQPFHNLSEIQTWQHISSKHWQCIRL